MRFGTSARSITAVAFTSRVPPSTWLGAAVPNETTWTGVESPVKLTMGSPPDGFSTNDRYAPCGAVTGSVYRTVRLFGPVT